MTGYAREQGQAGDVSWVWEIKSLNGRGLEMRTRLPTGFDRLDLPAREQVQKRITRGNIALTLSLKQSTTAKRPEVDEGVLAHYAELASRWHSKLPGFAPPSIDGMLALKGVIDPVTEDNTAEVPETVTQPILDSLHQTLEALCKMRAVEGKKLAAVLTGKLGEIADLVGKARQNAALDPASIRERLQVQVKALLDQMPALTEDRLAQEAALIAAKADIGEELDRLDAHIAQARDLVSGSEAVGRKLDFLCQEFNREANTLCAKAGELALTRIGLDLKAVIEQFREQVQNIE
jgi:uncharacterized protein (TIGR00255 family)